MNASTLTASTGTAPADPSTLPASGRALLRRWPAALGLTSAALIVATVGADRDTLARTAAVAALCYLGAGALGRPWIAWAGIGAGGAVVLLSEHLGLPWWTGVAVTALGLVAAGLVRRAPLPALTAQTAAMAGFGGLAVATTFLAPQAGLVLAALVLGSHALWDAVHHRRNAVVSRPLAEFCMFLDVPLAAGALVLALT